MSDRTITHIRQNGPRHEHIERYVWVDADGAGDASDKATMVDWMENRGGLVYVESGTERVPVGIVRPQVGEPYLRSHADGKWTNDLLALPRF